MNCLNVNIFVLKNYYRLLFSRLYTATTFLLVDHILISIPFLKMIIQTFLIKYYYCQNLYNRVSLYTN